MLKLYMIFLILKNFLDTPKLVPRLFMELQVSLHLRSSTTAYVYCFAQWPIA